MHATMLAEARGTEGDLCREYPSFLGVEAGGSIVSEVSIAALRSGARALVAGGLRGRSLVADVPRGIPTGSGGGRARRRLPLHAPGGLERRRVVLAGNFRGLQPFQTAPRNVTASSLVGFGNGVTYTVYGPTAIVKLGAGFGLQLDVEGAFNTKNLATGTVFRGGLTFAR